MQVHRPRNAGCPICGEQRFKLGTNDVQHVESGYCAGCLGVDNTRNQIYEFASSKPQMQHYLHDVDMLTNAEAVRATFLISLIIARTARRYSAT
jgi:hypothetical protein